MRAKIVVIGLLLAAALLMAGGVQAASSANYHLDWALLLNGGGGAASSEAYTLKATYGQTVSGERASENYRAVLGFWGREAQHLPVFLPAVRGKP